MKKQHLLISILFSFIAIIGSNPVFAQTAAKVDTARAEQLKTQLIASVCSCVSKADTSKVKTADDVQGVLMQCFMTDGMSLFMDYANASGVDLTDTQKIQEWGQKIGMELTFKCPALIKMLTNVIKDPEEFKKLQEESQGGVSTDTLTKPKDDSKPNL